MQREARAYLWDIECAASDIETFIAGKNESIYAEDGMLRAAVERKFEVIGEALTQLLRHFPHYHDRIAYSGKIIAFRNQLIHGYESVRDDIVWEIAKSFLPELRQQVHDLLGEAGDSEMPPESA